MSKNVTFQPLPAAKEEEQEQDIPFNIGGIVERSSTQLKKSLSSGLKPMTKSTSSFPKPVPNKKYTTRAATTTETSNPATNASSFASSSAMNQQQKKLDESHQPTRNERPIETSEFMQILRETLKQSSSQQQNQQQSQSPLTPLKYDPGSQEQLPSSDDKQAISATSMDSILRVARSAVPAQRAAALRALQARCEAWDQEEKTHQQNAKTSSSSSNDYFINAPPDVASSLFHPEESGPRLAMLSHLAYEDASQTVREAALLMWLTLLSSEKRRGDDDVLDTVVLAAITGAPTDDGDNNTNNKNNDPDNDENEDEDTEEQRKIDEEELRKRRLLAGGDTVPREMDDVDLRCGPTGVRIERKYFTLEAVSNLLKKDAALGLARLGVYRTLLDRAVGRAADHDPVGSSLNPVVGGATLLDNRSLWRAVAMASHESPTAAAYICEHKSFFIAFQSLIQATIGAHPRHSSSSSSTTTSSSSIPTQKLGKNLLPCVRDGLLSIFSAVHSNSTRAHRMLPKLWSEGGIFLLLKYLELIVAETFEQEQEQEKQQREKHIDPTSSCSSSSNHHHHSASSHFKYSYVSQCCALLCCIIRAAVRFGVPLSSESLPFEEAEAREMLLKKENKEEKQQEQNTNTKTETTATIVQNPEVNTWFGEVYSFLIVTAKHVGSFAVLEMLLMNEVMTIEAAAKTGILKPKPTFVRQFDKKEGDDEQSGEDDEEKEEEEEIRFEKTDLKRTMDDIVFPCVNETLDKILSSTTKDDNNNNIEHLVDFAATTGSHLLATWIGDGSLLAIFHGDRDEKKTLTNQIEPLLEKSFKVLQMIYDLSNFHHQQESDETSSSSSSSFCMVVDAFAHGLARIVDAVSRCYPKVRSRIAFNLQSLFSVLIVHSNHSRSVFSVGSYHQNKNNGGEENVDVILQETKQMVAEILGHQQQQSSGEKSSITVTFSKEQSLSKLTRLSAVGELLRTAQWMLSTTKKQQEEGPTKKTQQQQNENVDEFSLDQENDNVVDDLDKEQQEEAIPVLLRSEVVTCVALNLIRVAMRCRGAADTAVSAGLALILPVKEGESAGVEHLREILAKSLVEITSTPNPKVALSLPVSLRLDPLSAWLLNPCLFSAASTTTIVPENVDEGSGGDKLTQQQPAPKPKTPEELQAEQLETMKLRMTWAQWIGDLVMKISSVASGVPSATAADQIRSLLPHPLSLLASTFLAAFCSENAQEIPPRFFTSSPTMRKVLENLASVAFTLCCCKQEFSSARKYLCREELRQFRKEAVETIVRCAGQNGDCMEMLFLLTTATVLRGSPNTWSPILSLWLERANWIFFNNDNNEKKLSSTSSLFVSAGCQKQSIVSLQDDGNSNNENNNKNSKNPFLLVNESDALQFCTSIVESLSSSSMFLHPDPNSSGAALPLLVRVAVSCIAQLSAPCSDFTKNTVLELVEERLWFGAEETVKELQKQFLDEIKSSSGKKRRAVAKVNEFWLKDL